MPIPCVLSCFDLFFRWTGFKNDVLRGKVSSELLCANLMRFLYSRLKPNKFTRFLRVDYALFRFVIIPAIIRKTDICFGIFYLVFRTN